MEEDVTMDAYKHLAEHLDSLPNGFPSTEDGSELRLLAKLFTPEEAGLAAELRSSPETVDEIASRTGRESSGLRKQLKALARGGLIEAGASDKGLVFQSMPFVVGIYEMQLDRMDEELARLFEDYYHTGMARMLSVEPQLHRVVPVHQAVDTSVEVQPYESAAEIVYSMKSWAVQDCVCRKQKALIGQACSHPVDVCLMMAPVADAFHTTETVRALSRDEAMATLRRAAEAGLVHTVTNSEEGAYYICSCCTCSCGILRGMAELGIANVVASSPFVNRVDEDLCTGCEDCIAACQFDALSMADSLAMVDRERCVGCGVCVLRCATDALVLVRRPPEEVKPIPRTRADWKQQRLAARGL
jgi:Na+-translocating ferredoxin:NAD+ oxidoreductase subunit B